MADVKMPLTAHLEELRWRLIKSLLAIAAGFIGCYNFAEPVLRILTRPLLAAADGGTVQLIGTGVVEAFFTKLKVAFIAAVFLASPVILYQIWQFVAPGLYDHGETLRPAVRLLRHVLLRHRRRGSATRWSSPSAIASSSTIRHHRRQPEIRISEYLSFTARMLLAFGADLRAAGGDLLPGPPRLGHAPDDDALSSRYAVLIIFIVAAVLTPGRTSPRSC